MFIDNRGIKLILYSRLEYTALHLAVHPVCLNRDGLYRVIKEYTFSLTTESYSCRSSNCNCSIVYQNKVWF